MALIEARGAVVSKNALMARVWPGRVVEENNLQSHISALRAALGRDREVIRTVSGRGYQFVGEILALPEGGDDRASLGPKAADPGALPPTNVPEPVSELIGREDELAEVVNLMGAHRLVTLTGAGGIGKTRLAVALARELRPPVHLGQPLSYNLLISPETKSPLFAKKRRTPNIGRRGQLMPPTTSVQLRTISALPGRQNGRARNHSLQTHRW